MSPDLQQARELLDECETLLQRSRPSAAKSAAVQAAALAGGDGALAARAATLLGSCHYVLDQHPEAMACLLGALDQWRGLGDRSGEARARAMIARILLQSGESHEALAESLAALEAAEQGGELRARMVSLTALGNVYLELAQFDDALAFCERAAETARLVGDPAAQAAAIDTLACVYGGMAEEARHGGDGVRAYMLESEASTRSREALALARRAGHRDYEATALGNLAESLALLGRHEEALALLDSWQPIPSDDDAPALNNHHLEARGRICMMLGRYHEAAMHFSRALARAESKRRAMTFSRELAEAYEHTGDLRAALDQYKHFHALHVDVNSETAHRSAGVAAVRLETAQAKANASEAHARAEHLQRSNEQLSRRSEDLMRQSMEDPLTGLPNRRLMDRLLAADALGYAVVLLDVDHFKQVNDRHSHLVGDEVLRELAALLRESCRASDTPVRYGGEEFAILLRQLAGYDAVQAAERVRASVAHHAWSRVVPGLQVTVSLGVACAGEAAGTADVVALADRRLYQAKAAGRNRVVGPETAVPPWAPAGASFGLGGHAG